MPLRGELEQIPETLGEFELAWQARWAEAQTLWVMEQHVGALYLLGYVAELLLKSAWFRFRGASPTDLVTWGLLGTAASQARALGLAGVGPESYHSLVFWAKLLRTARRRENVPLPPEVDAPFVQRTRRLYQNWWVGARYRRAVFVPQVLETAFGDVTWLRDNHRGLWRR